MSERMTDEQLAAYLGIAGHPKAQAVIDSLPPQRRAVYDRMASVEMEVDLWLLGIGPKPQGVLIDLDPSARKRRPTP